MKLKSGELVTADYLNGLVASISGGGTGTGGRGFCQTAYKNTGAFYVTEWVDDDGETTSRVVYPPHTIFNPNDEPETTTIDEDLRDKKISIIAIENDYGITLREVPTPFHLYVIAHVDDEKTDMTGLVDSLDSDYPYRGFVVGEAESKGGSSGGRTWETTSYIGNSMYPLTIYLSHEDV